MKKYLSKIIIGLLVLGFAAGCGNSNNTNESSIAAIKKRGYIRIGVFGDNVPFGYVDKSGQLKGYDVYLAHRVAKDLFGDPNKAKLVIVNAANRVEFLAADKVDLILANFTATPQRAKVVDFGLPYMKVSIGVASPKSALITNVSQLDGKTLITNKGTTADAYFTKNYPNIKLLKFDQKTQAFGAFLDGRGAAITDDNTILFAWVKQNPKYEVAISNIGDVQYIVPAVKKGNKDLQTWIDNEIKKLYKENFFYKDYEATLAPFYGNSVKPSSVVVDK